MKTKSALTAVLIVLVVAGIAAGGYGLLRFKAKDASPLSVANGKAALPALWPTSDHPWPMFHGNYDHSGYADVIGPTSGKLKWKYMIGATEGNWPNSVVVAKDGTILVAGGNKITALGTDGTLKWAKDYQMSQGPGLSADGKTVYAAAGSSLIAASSADGTKQWEFKAANNMIFGPTIGPDGTIYQGSWDKYFYAINPDGSLKWKCLTKGTISYPASIDKSGRVYLGGGDAHFGPDGNVYAFDSDGKLLWTYDTQMLRVGTPAVGQDGLIYLPASPKLIVLNANGKLMWQKGPDIPKPTVTAAGQTQNGDNGQNNSAAPCAPPPAPCGNATGANNAPGAAPAGASASTAGELGNEGAPGAMEDVIAGIITPALTLDGLIYIGNPQGKFMAIDATSHEIKWSYQTGKNPEPGIDYGLPSFVLTDKTGTVYFGALDHKFYALDKTGQLKWAYATGGKITEASPAFGLDGTLYFTSEDGYIYAIGG